MHKHRSGFTTTSKNHKPRDRVADFARSYRPQQNDINRLVEEFFIALDTPLSLSCLILFRHGEFQQLVEKDIYPLNYEDPYLFRDDFAAISFLRKNRFLKTEIDLKSKAISGFLKSEEQCRSTNQRFEDLISDPQFMGRNSRILSNMCRKISNFLDAFSIDELLDAASWGPGVSTLIKGKELSASRKFSDENGITSRAYRLFGDVARLAYPTWQVWQEDSTRNIQKGNQVITVPKSAKTDRTIAIEPGLNSWFQLGMGKVLRRRLCRSGYDLNSDLKNQRSAYRGSLDSSLATVDFSSASDTIAYNVVREVIPGDWFAVLDSLRSSHYHLEGKLHSYQKFSAMGNGFTFELESLIFVTAALAVCDELGLPIHDVSVFGDDIIIPNSAFSLYSEFCSFLGFTVNPQKSFSTGYFRESCGSYYFRGVDVKPLFLKEAPRNAKSIYRLANSIRAFSHRRNNYYGCDWKFGAVWKYLVRRLPKDLRIFGTVDSGDFSIHVNFDEGCPTRARDQIEGWYHPALVSSPARVARDDLGLLLSRLRSASTLTPRGNLDELRAVTKTRFRKRFFVRRWYNFGPWI